MNMRKYILYASVICVGLFSLAACHDDEMVIVSDKEPEMVENIDSYHDQSREFPFPKVNNELYLNPTPLFVPEKMKVLENVQFALSRNAEFSEEETVVSEPRPWCMYNPHRLMETGTWYWRFRCVGQNGLVTDWSEIYQFEVKDETPRFLTPSFGRFEYGMPKDFPRLYPFLDAGMEKAREKVTEHPEYKLLLGRAKPGLAFDCSKYPNPYDGGGDICGHIEMMYQAYVLTQDTDYRDKMLEIARYMIAYPEGDRDLFGGNFHMAALLRLYARIYDACHGVLTPAERTRIAGLIYRILDRWYKIDVGSVENTMFSNHYWQKCYRSIVQGLLMLHDNPDCPDVNKLNEMWEYYYELWTARAPAHGFNRDGSWLNGGYYGVNIVTLTYVPSLFSHCSGTDFLQHPWYKSAGRALAYTQPGMLFGDQSGRNIGEAPERIYLAFADYLARETRDPYSAWCAMKFSKNMREDYELRLYRMVRDWQDEYNYAGLKLPNYKPGFTWYKDAGEVSMLSNLEDVENNLRLAFRSSPFGSGRHKHSDQNSFNLIYKNTYVYHNSGYYLNSQDPHNLMSYRHTRAHNTILVNGIGQPYSIAAYGNVVRGMGGQRISYCLGDASNAYRGDCDNAYDEILAKAGIEQSAENGFGPTPLSKYRRHVLMLNQEKIVVLYDELEATESVTWDWLLHSNNQILVDGSTKVTTAFPDKGFSSEVTVFTDYKYETRITDQFMVDPDLKFDPSAVCPNQWHFSLAFAPTPKNRILSVIRIIPDDEEAEPLIRDGNSVECGDWVIEAELDGEKVPKLIVRHREDNVLFCYGYEAMKVSGISKQPGSSLLRDNMGNGMEVVEMMDRNGQQTRTLN